MQAFWKGTLVADSSNTITLDGNIYFPKASLKYDFFRESPDSTYCGVKGKARYWDLIVDGQLKANAAWSYESPKEEAEKIRGMVSFSKELDVN